MSDKQTAKFFAYGKVKEGQVVDRARTRVLVRWVLDNGKSRDTWFMPTTEEGFEKAVQNGITRFCLVKDEVVSPRVARAQAKRQQARQVVLPDGQSARARRLDLIAQSTLHREAVRNCEHCNHHRAEMHRTAEEAEHLYPAAIEEAAAADGRAVVRHIKYGGTSE
jgi:hypothetical protein